MPNPQVGKVDQYQFGAKPDVATVLQFGVRRGGLVDLVFLNAVGAESYTYSVEVSADGSSWNATTSANNVAAITSQTVVPKGHKNHTFLLREGVDLHWRVTVSGNGRGELQVRKGEAVFEPLVDKMGSFPAI